jgi:hypothetical protein
MNRASPNAAGEPYELAISRQTIARPARPNGIENKLGGVCAKILIPRIDTLHIDPSSATSG